ncbi:MAG: hypothetical protein JWM87_2505 [Candidatus Eremiobacteraeota bacterium]|nr:hypothetical protein [Candidatus Eremiobacteraeota bacterium]
MSACASSCRRCFAIPKSSLSAAGTTYDSSSDRPSILTDLSAPRSCRPRVASRPQPVLAFDAAHQTLPQIRMPFRPCLRRQLSERQDANCEHDEACEHAAHCGGRSDHTAGAIPHRSRRRAEFMLHCRHHPRRREQRRRVSFWAGLAIRAAILIDGSNLLGALARAGLGYPALGPLIELLRGKDDLVFARFYAAPPPEEPWKGWFLAMQRANRHIEGLEFFQGYRTPDRKEKVIDVALAVDLIEGIFENRFDRADVFGGDGDHLYALKVAHEEQRARIRVHLAPGQRLYAVGKARIPFTMWSAQQFVNAGIVARRAHAPVPRAGAAPRSAGWSARIRAGAFGTIAPPPPGLNERVFTVRRGSWN